MSALSQFVGTLLKENQVHRRNVKIVVDNGTHKQIHIQKTRRSRSQSFSHQDCQKRDRWSRMIKRNASDSMLPAPRRKQSNDPWSPTKNVPWGKERSSGFSKGDQLVSLLIPQRVESPRKTSSERRKNAIWKGKGRSKRIHSIRGDNSISIIERNCYCSSLDADQSHLIGEGSYNKTEPTWGQLLNRVPARRRLIRNVAVSPCA